MGESFHLQVSRKTALSLLVAGVIMSVIGGVIISRGFSAREKVIMTLHGELIPFNVDLSKPFTIALSEGVNFLYSSSELASGFDLNDIFPFNLNLTSDQFKIEFIDNKLSVSAKIKNSDEVIIAQIVNNEWKTVDPSTLLFWDRNYNAYAFEIIGSNNVPTLQVITIGPNKIQICGLFYTQTGRFYVQSLQQDAVLWKNPTDQELENANISRIFKYPALTNPNNLGKMVNPIYPTSDPLAESTLMIILGSILAITGSILTTFGGFKVKSLSNKNDEKKGIAKISKKRPKKQSLK